MAGRESGSSAESQRADERVGIAVEPIAVEPIAAESIKAEPIFDTHVHLWQPIRPHWIQAGSALDRDFGLDDVRAAMGTCGVRGGVLVEATNTPQEIPWLLEIAAKESHPWGVVGWIDLDQPDAVEQIAHYSRDPRFKGVRMNWFEERTLPAKAVMRAMRSGGLVLELLTNWEALPEIALFIAEHPDNTFVLDHFGGAVLSADGLPEWESVMTPLAGLPNVAVKVSGFHGVEAAVLRGFVDSAVGLFGAERLMFGSDYPLGDSGTRYSDTVTRLQAHLDRASRSLVFCHSAQRWYGLR
jgi:L-fuconolactonase